MFRPVLVVDGNFKADDVKQKNDNDVWLIDGGGMVPNQKEYSAFFKKKLSRYPWCVDLLPKSAGTASGSDAEPESGPVICFVNVLFSIIRRLLVKTDSKQ